MNCIDNFHTPFVQLYVDIGFFQFFVIYVPQISIIQLKISCVL